MTADRIKEIQDKTAFPDSVSVYQALLQVWNECEQDNKEKKYTEDDMIKCWKYASMDKHQIFGDQIGEYYLSFIKSL